MDSTTSKALWIEVYKAFLFERLLNKIMFLKIIKTQKVELINQINLNLFDKEIYFISAWIIINLFTEAVLLNNSDLN